MCALASFNDAYRGFPYEEVTITNVAISEFENGYEQRRDLWNGNTKKQFNITFNVKSESEIEDIRDYFVTKIGPKTSFTFTNPIDSTAYTVRFVENSFTVRRIHYAIYEATCSLIEVF